MDSTYIPQIQDHVSCPAPAGGMQPYTGVVVEIFVGFVRVQFDKPQGQITSALTSPAKLTLISRKASTASVSSPQVFPQYTPPDLLAPVESTPPFAHVAPPEALPPVQPGKPVGKSMAKADLQTGPTPTPIPTENVNETQPEAVVEEPVVDQKPATENSLGASSSTASK